MKMIKPSALTYKDFSLSKEETIFIVLILIPCRKILNWTADFHLEKNGFKHKYNFEHKEVEIPHYSDR